MPVFVINGFLEAGKTRFITNTLQQDYFRTDGTTVLILCEEGDTEYDPKENKDKDRYRGRHLRDGRGFLRTDRGII